MAVVDVLNQKGEKVSQAELAEGCFNIEIKSSVLHEVVTMQLAKRRAGSAAHAATLHPLRMCADTVTGETIEALAINEVSLLRESRQAAKIGIDEQN